MLCDDVTYKPVSGFDGYRVGSDGSVWSLWHRPVGSPAHHWVIGTEWNLLTPIRRGPERRASVTLCPGRRQEYVHILVAEAFLGPRPDGMWCCHNDGNKDNNRASNLRWDTPSANQMDKVAHGTHNRGVRHNMVKLTEAAVLSIRAEYRRGRVRQQDLADKHEVSVATISMIVNRKVWAHLPESEAA